MAGKKVSITIYISKITCTSTHCLNLSERINLLDFADVPAGEKVQAVRKSDPIHI